MGRRADRRGRAASERRPALVTPAFLAVSFATLAYFVAVAATLPTLPLFVRGPLAGGNVAVGVTVGSFSLAAILLRPLAGWLADARGRRPIIVAGAGIAAASTAAFALVDSVSAVVALRLLGGVGEAMFFTGAAAAIADLAPDERRGEAVSFFSLALYIGLAVGPIVGEAVLGPGRFDAVWLVAAAGMLLAATLAVRVPDTRGERGAGRSRLLHPAAFGPGAVVATSIWGFAGFASFVPLYARQLGMGGSRFVFFTYSVVVIAIRLFGARIPDAVGPRRTASVSLVVSLAGLLVVAGWAAPVGLFAGTMVFAVGQALAFPALMTLAVAGAPAARRGAVVGTFTAFVDLAFGMGPVTLGVVAAGFGYRGAFVAGAAMAAVGFALLRLQPERRARAPAAEASSGVREDV